MRLARALKFGGILFVLALYFVLTYPVQIALLAARSRHAHTLPMLFWRLLLRLMGTKVRVVGKVALERPLLLLSNHVSWLDIPVLGSLFPLSFIAKSEIERWPVIGHMSRLQRTIFIDRTRRTATREANEAISERLASGDALVLFPEGTSGEGTRVLPFRSSLLGGVRQALDSGGASDIRVQPVAIVYRGYRGLPMDRRLRPIYAWFGDMELATSLVPAVADGVIEIDVVFGAPETFAPETDRKRVTRDMERAVAAMLYEGLTGRRPLDASAPEIVAQISR